MIVNNIKIPGQVSRLRAFLDSSKMIKNPIKIFDNYACDLGDTYTFHFGGIKKAIISSNPVFIQHILKTNYENYHKSDIQIKRMGHFLGKGLLTSHGKYWLTQRRLIQQGFHKDQLVSILGSMKEVLNESLEIFDKEIKKGGPIDIYPEMMKITFGMVNRSLFSTNFTHNELTVISKAISTVQEFMVRQIIQPYLNLWFRVSGELHKHEKIRYQADKIILKHIQKRRNDSETHHDLLQILLDSKYHDTGEGMTDIQLLSESIQLLVAGHETSSNALSWSLYLLCKNPDCIEKIRQELKSKIGDAQLEFDDLPKLEYTTQVIEEAMRLYPPFWMVDREPLEDDHIMGIMIPKGTTVISFIYGVHHSSEYWKDPEKFVPERFNKENKKNHLPFTHLPFGGGPRGCIGGSYAMMQMILILITMIRKYTFDLLPNDKTEMKPMIILRPKDGIKMNFTKN